MPIYIAIADAEVAPEKPITSSLMTRLRDNALGYLGAPSGTRQLFQQTAAPLGWTKDATHHDKGLRLSNTTVTTGGSIAFSTVFGRTATDGHALTTAQLAAHVHAVDITTGDQNNDHVHPLATLDTGPQDASHNHPYEAYNSQTAISYQSGAVELSDVWIGSQERDTNSQSADHNHELDGNTAVESDNHQHLVDGDTESTGGGDAHTHPIDLRLQFVDVILASKD